MEASRAVYQGKEIIVGRDELNVVKTVVHKLYVFEELLRNHPSWASKVVARSSSSKSRRLWVTSPVGYVACSLGSLKT